MELVMTNGFADLSVAEMEMIDGGFDAAELCTGLTAFIGLEISAAGLVGSAAAVAICANPAVMIAVFGAYVVAAGASGYLVGDSFMH